MCPVTAFVPLATLPLAVLTMLVNVSRPAFFLQNRVPPKPNGNLIVEFVDDRGVGAWITADVELPGWGGACHGVTERRAQPALTPGRCRRLNRSVTHAPNPPGARVLACSRVPAQTARLQPRDAPSAGSVF